MKLFRNKKTGEMLLGLDDTGKVLLSFDGKTAYLGGTEDCDYEEVDTKAKSDEFRRLHVVEESFSIGCDKEWHLKDILYVPVDGKEIAFRVEHITKDRVYFVAVDAVGESTMNDMSDFLDNFLRKMPDSLVERMLEIEHSVEGKMIRKSKLTLLSHGNVVCGDTRCDGADDIPFAGFTTEAERCKNLDRETCWYWTDSPYAGYSANFVSVGGGGNPSSNSGASNTYAVVPCFSIRKQQNADCEE